MTKKEVVALLVSIAALSVSVTTLYRTQYYANHSLKIRTILDRFPNRFLGPGGRSELRVHYAIFNPGNRQAAILRLRAIAATANGGFAWGPVQAFRRGDDGSFVLEQPEGEPLSLQPQEIRTG